MSKEDEILRQAPFRNVLRINDVKDIECLKNDVSISGEAFKIRSAEGKFYKLRHCRWLRDAWRIQGNVKKLKHIFPRFYGREGKYLLFEWLDAPDLKKLKEKGGLDEEHFKELGRLCGEVHEFDEKGDSKKVRQFFDWCINGLLKEGIIDKELHSRLTAIYEEKSKKFKKEVVLELYDLNLANLAVNPRTGKMVLIDEEGIKHKIKGFGMMNQFVTHFSKEQKEAFMEGYESVHSAAYLDDSYKDFLAFYTITRDVWIKANTGRPYQKLLDRLIEYLKKNG
ncbi:MAG: hypothetical protein V1729_02335 [Candidatus Woesearchaeota archaeon]